MSCRCCALKEVMGKPIVAVFNSLGLATTAGGGLITSFLTVKPVVLAAFSGTWN